MDAKDIVAVIMAATFLLAVVLRAVLAYLFPTVIPPAENLTLWIDLFNTVAGGLLVYIGTKIDR